MVGWHEPSVCLTLCGGRAGPPQCERSNQTVIMTSSDQPSHQITTLHCHPGSLSLIIGREIQDLITDNYRHTQSLIRYLLTISRPGRVDVVIKMSEECEVCNVVRGGGREEGGGWWQLIYPGCVSSRLRSAVAGPDCPLAVSQYLQTRPAGHNTATLQSQHQHRPLTQ